jgi:hypothetical protein
MSKFNAVLLAMAAHDLRQPLQLSRLFFRAQVHAKGRQNSIGLQSPWARRPHCGPRYWHWHTARPSVENLRWARSICGATRCRCARSSHRGPVQGRPCFVLFDPSKGRTPGGVSGGACKSSSDDSSKSLEPCMKL